MGDKAVWVCVGTEAHFTGGRLHMLVANVAVKHEDSPFFFKDLGRQEIICI